MRAGRSPAERSNASTAPGLSSPVDTAQGSGRRADLGEDYTVELWDRSA